MAINPYSLFRVYDLGVSNWLDSFCIYRGKPIMQVMAPPERAFSTLKFILQKRGYPRPPDCEGNITPLPFISIARGSFTLDKTRASRVPLRFAFYPDGSKHECIWTTFPQPVHIPYQIEFWSKYVQTAADITDAIMMQFHMESAFMDVIHAEPMGKRRTHIFWNSYDNNTELEGGDDDRTIRYTLNVRVDGWYFHPMYRGLVAKTLVLETRLGTVEYPSPEPGHVGPVDPDDDESFSTFLAEKYTPMVEV